MDGQYIGVSGRLESMVVTMVDTVQLLTNRLCVTSFNFNQGVEELEVMNENGELKKLLSKFKVSVTLESKAACIKEHLDGGS